ncbi:thermonuclease family protein [Pseudoponticoccus marisrubri]|uniref:Nuclease n=1 Tax=Pseudoponticoccus marisrubri TaxID=1685382 RepID=A0A0W7WNY7_9RHOB|nr:thermonuclease family protein [Pseudoponticoccus marisrubri]KUF12231.1 nuclease [Pseudoponticoccus marisrubri]
MLRVCSALVLLCAALPGLADTQRLSGPARVIDGDTFEVAGTTVRLYGVDALEVGQVCGGRDAPTWSCGAWATGEIRARYEGRVLDCTVLAHDAYGRSVARCTDFGTDVGRALVRAGLAFAYRRYSEEYVPAERAARAEGVALHGTGAQSPEAYRAAKREVRAARRRADAPEGCLIKGNISQGGRARIYHLPGQSWYGRTRISPEKGERWFCSEAEAVAAGWRRARR